MDDGIDKFVAKVFIYVTGSLRTLRRARDANKMTRPDWNTCPFPDPSGLGANDFLEHDGRCKRRGDWRTRVDEGFPPEKRKKGGGRETAEGEGRSEETSHSLLEERHHRETNSKGTPQIWFGYFRFGYYCYEDFAYLVDLESALMICCRLPLALTPE